MESSLAELQLKLQRAERPVAAKRESRCEQHELAKVADILCQYSPQAYAPVGEAAKSFRNKRHSEAGGISDHSSGQQGP